LLHAALRKVLGEHVAQAGSRVDSKSLRFDFSNPNGLSPEQLAAVEALVNGEIRRNVPVSTQIQSIEDAKAAGAMALFGEKYDDEVRVVSMGDFSMELCGGLHVQRTGDIGAFRLTSEAAVAAGVRRIEAVSGVGAEQIAKTEQNLVSSLTGLFRCKPEEVLHRIQALQDQQKKLEKELEQLGDMAAAAQVAELKSQAQSISGAAVILARFDKLDKSRFGKIVEQLAAHFEGIAVLSNTETESASIAVTVAKSLHSNAKAGELVAKIAALAGGKGGGRPDRAQAGTKEVALVGAAMDAALGIVTEALA
jgi:alanyl-tRNA synthetase